jgi:hypothetical protein
MGGGIGRLADEVCRIRAGGQVVEIARIAKVEQRKIARLRVMQRAVQDFQFGDGP